jgi:hypothetical protein
LNEDFVRQVTRLEQRLDGLVRPEAPLTPPGLVLISETELGASAASVTFSSIPGTYRSLLIVVQARTDKAASDADTVNVRFNGDTGNNYDRLAVVFGNSATSYGPSRASSSMLSVAMAEASGSRASNFAPALMFAPDYAATDREKWLQVLNSPRFGDVAADSDVLLRIAAGRWRSSSAVTSITFLPNTGTNFVADSKFTLYGVL